MIRFLLRCLPALILLFGATHTAVAQEPGSRAEEQARQQAAKAQTLTTYQPNWLESRILAIEDAGGFGVARGFVVKFGDIKRGSGLAPGVGYGRTMASGATFTTKGVYSIKNYKLLQAAAQSPLLAHDTALFRARARWQDAPKVPLYPVSPNPSEFRTDFSETKTEISGEVLARPVRLIRTGGGLGLEWFDVDFPRNA